MANRTMKGSSQKCSFWGNGDTGDGKSRCLRLRFCPHPPNWQGATERCPPSFALRWRDSRSPPSTERQVQWCALRTKGPDACRVRKDARAGFGGTRPCFSHLTARPSAGQTRPRLLSGPDTGPGWTRTRESDNGYGNFLRF